MFFVFYCRLCERRKCTFHLVTYSVHVLVDSTWNVSLTAGMLIIYRTLWLDTRDRRLNQQKQCSQCRWLRVGYSLHIDCLQWITFHVISWYQESFLWLLSSTKVANSVPLLVGTWVKLCVALLISEFLSSTTLISGIRFGESPNCSYFNVLRGSHREGFSQRVNT